MEKKKHMRHKKGGSTLQAEQQGGKTPPDRLWKRQRGPVNKKSRGYDRAKKKNFTVKTFKPGTSARRRHQTGDN